MLPLLFRVGPVSVYSFGTMMALGFIAGGFVLERALRRGGWSPDAAWAIVGAAVVGGIVGGRLALAVQHWDAFVAAPGWFLASPSGFIWYGGLLGGVAATLVPIRRYGIPWRDAADAAAPALALGYACGKLGCHLAGDGDWGTPTTVPWAVAYLHGTARWPHAPGVRVHPAPLYELAASLAIFAVLWTMRDRPHAPGWTFGWYAVLAGTARLLVEFVRTNPPAFLGLTAAQWWSVALVAGGGWLLVGARPQPAPGATARTARRAS